MNPLPKLAGVLGTIVAVLATLSASDSVAFINNLMTSIGLSTGAEHTVGVVLGVIGSVVALLAHAPTATSANAPPAALPVAPAAPTK